MNSRQLPSVDRLVESLGEWPLPRQTVVGIVRALIDEIRVNGADVDLEAESRLGLEARVGQKLHKVLNATGVLLHTNLGRAPLSPEAAQAAAEVATGYSSLELDVRTGTRGGARAISMNSSPI